MVGVGVEGAGAYIPQSVMGVGVVQEGASASWQVGDLEETQCQRKTVHIVSK